jgi:UDP-N-acetylmuramoylalanine--D-glutamate ligase
LDLDEQTAKAALADFRGLPHRLEFVRTVGGVDFINDSKSTAPQATVTALLALREDENSGIASIGASDNEHANEAAKTVLIVGGQEKPEPLEDMPAEITRRCRAVICMGQCGAKYAAAIRGATSQGDATSKLRVEITTSLDKALALAIESAKSGDRVLFSPGAPSFDAYNNFADRGEHFVRLVNGLTTTI